MKAIIAFFMIILLCVAKDDPKYDTLYREKDNLGD